MGQQLCVVYKASRRPRFAQANRSGLGGKAPHPVRGFTDGQSGWLCGVQPQSEAQRKTPWCSRMAGGAAKRFARP